VNSFVGFKVGDRVRVFDEKTQNEATFIITAARGDELSSGKNSYFPEDWTYVEVLKPRPKPLPTKDGLYIPADHALARVPTVLVCLDGEWSNVPLSVDPRATARIHHDRAGLVRLVVES
jgi:hypothetical protein